MPATWYHSCSPLAQRQRLSESVNADLRQSWTGKYTRPLALCTRLELATIVVPTTAVAPLTPDSKPRWCQSASSANGSEACVSLRATHSPTRAAIGPTSSFICTHQHAVTKKFPQNQPACKERDGDLGPIVFFLQTCHPLPPPHTERPFVTLDHSMWACAGWSSQRRPIIGAESLQSFSASMAPSCSMRQYAPFCGMQSVWYASISMELQYRGGGAPSSRCPRPPGLHVGLHVTLKAARSTSRPTRPLRERSGSPSAAQTVLPPVSHVGSSHRPCCARQHRVRA